MLKKRVTFKTAPKKTVGQYLKEWLDPISATYETDEGVIRIVPLKKPR